MRLSLIIFIASMLRLCRASLVVLALGLTLAMTNVCPTGQTDCDMPEMAKTMEPAGVCVLACGVLLPVGMAVTPDFSSNASSIPLPEALTGISFLPEPAFRPPRFFA